MQIEKRNRAELKQYFVKNAIPTESNFAEFIDAMLSQRDDGIVKLPNAPLSIEAAGDSTSQKKAIHFYASFQDSDPAWVLSLNPRQNPADAATARPGFSISDSAGNSRLFIDRATGRVGMGTNDPKKLLHVQGTTSGPFINDTHDRPAIGITGGYPELALFSNVNNLNHGPTIRLGSYTDATTTTFKQWVIGTSGRNASFLDIGFSDRSDPNPHAGIRNYNGKTVMTLRENGTIGIGTLTPTNDLTIRRDVASALGPVLSLIDGSGGTGAGTAIDMSGYDPAANQPTVRLQSVDDGSFSSHLLIYTKVPGAAANALKERMRVASGGNVLFTGAIVPAAGNSASVGIQFPLDPGGGSGDEAFIRYYPLTGESCKLMIGINNDAGDTIGFWQGGAERMTVGDGWIDVGSNANPIRFTSAWSGSPDGVLNRAEISNDTGTYKTLMIIGNRSAGGTRRVSVWDKLEVNGEFWVNNARRFDLAEVTPVVAEENLEQGDVVVIDREAGTRVRRSTRRYDSAVYGVVSSYQQAAMVIGGFEGADRAMDKLPIALVGRVKIKVCGENGRIHVGDRLSTSSTPGHAMRFVDADNQVGAICGKALESFAGETGIITALVTLQ